MQAKIKTALIKMFKNYGQDVEENWTDDEECISNSHEKIEQFFNK